MKKNLIYLSLITILLSGSSFGYVLIGEGKVSDPIITGTSGSGVVEKPLTAQQQAEISRLSKDKKKTFLSASARVSVSNSKGRAGEYIKISGDHTVNITNNTSQRQSYRYTYNLQCSSASSNYSRNVDLSPGASFYDSSNNYTTLQASLPGSYRINGETSVSGESSARDTSYGTATVNK
jgi:hypothetical protein